MTVISSSTPKSNDVLTALAVLGQADYQALAALLDRKLTEADWVEVRSNPAVSEVSGQLRLTLGQAVEILASLEREDLPRYRHLHERAIDLLATHFQTGDENTEPGLIVVFDRLANRLLTDDPGHLMALVEQLQALPLKLPSSRHRCAYFEAAALRKAESYAESVAVSEALLSEPDLDSWVRGRTLNSRAICYRVTGRFEAAFADYRQSLAIFQQAGYRLDEGLVLLNMGITAYDLQNYNEAETYLSQAEIVFEEIGSLQWLASVHNELGLLHRDQGHWGESLACFEKFIARRRAEKAHDQVGRGLNNIGEVLLFQGRLDEAVAALIESLEKMTTRVYRVDTHVNLGLAYQAKGNLVHARIAFQEALDLALAIGRRDFLPHVHYHLGDVLRRLGDDAAALEHFRAGVEVIEASRAPLRDEELKISLLGRWQQVYEGLVLHCLALNRPAEAFEWAERSRARAFVEALLPEQPSPDAEEETGEQEARFSWPTGVTLKSIQASLPADSSLLSYFTTGVLERDVPLLRAIPAENPLREHLLTPARTLLFVLTRQSLTAHNCSLDPNMFGTASPRQDSADRFLSPAVRQRLYAALIGIAHEALSARQLYLVPHGPLHSIPFVALLEEDDKRSAQSRGPYLTYVPNATILAHQGAFPDPQPVQNLSGLAIGYSGGQDGRKLRYTEPEAVMVRNLMGGQTWVGAQPKKEQLREIVGQQRWLHFACHGWFNHEQPLESYIETGLDERLTAREVMQEWRLQAELVTLSACQTGVSRILRGDEPMGLMRAFLYAGAKAVLISQWAVEDLPTFLLMYHFYRELRESKRANLSAALYAAQQWLRRFTAAQAKALLTSWPTQEGLADDLTILTNQLEDVYPFAHPRHWAAFILVGRA